jgi:hypothetical protein
MCPQGRSGCVSKHADLAARINLKLSIHRESLKRRRLLKNIHILYSYFYSLSIQALFRNASATGLPSPCTWAWRRHELGSAARARSQSADARAHCRHSETKSAKLAPPGSSAGGEHPKFTTSLRSGKRIRHAVVKFSPLGADAVSQRWADLLVSEHLATEALRRSGLTSASSELLAIDGRIFLEANRFDRTGVRGRVGIVSLAAVANHYLGRRDNWISATSSLIRIGQRGKLRPILGGGARRPYARACLCPSWGSSARAVHAVPTQHTQRPERIPPTRLAHRLIEREGERLLVRLIEEPSTVGLPLALDEM